MSNDTPIKVKSRHGYIRKHPKFTGCLVDEDGAVAWYKNGQWHRTDGPALEHEDGNKWWFLNGKQHRTDGPACEYANGTKRWWLKGKHHTEQEHRLAVRQMKLKLLDDIGQHSL